MSLANARKSPSDSPLAADYSNTFVATPQYNLGLHDDCPLTSCFVKKSETVLVLLKSCIKAKPEGSLQTSVHMSFFFVMAAGASSTSKRAASTASPSDSSLSPPSTAQFARAVSDAAQRKDEAFMRKIFNRHATKEKLTANALIAALKDVAAPVLAVASSEGCDSAEYVFRRADAILSGDVDFSE
jgi:hypothetical protein